MEREARHLELAQRYLPDDRLARFRERAAVYDRENRFFDEDLAELRECGYLKMLAPEDRGGAGLTINQAARLQQRLATAAPATALGINMHLLCLAIARVMADRGDATLAWTFDEAAAGEIFALGVSEPGNDWVLQGSTTRAERQADGGYLLSGAKVFTSLSPAWTRLLVHGLDGADPARPRLVYGFIERGAGVTVTGAWNVSGMRATHSRTTILERARLAPERIARKVPPGRRPDPLTLAISMNFQLLIGSVYAGIARRALTLAADALRQRHSLKHETRFSDIPEYRVRLADAWRAFLPVAAELDLYTRDVDECVDHGKAWPLLLVSARVNASVAARRAVEVAMMCAGGASYARGGELERLQRDALASLFHPASVDAARPMYAAALLDD